MIDDVKDISVAEKQKKLKRQRLLAYFGKCICSIIVATFAVVLFSLYMLGDFIADFTLERSLETTGRFLSVFIVFFIMMIGVYKYSKTDKVKVRDFHLTLITAVVAFIASIATSKLLNVYAMPIALATYVALQLIGRRTSVLVTAVVGILVMFAYTSELHQYDLGVVAFATICNSLGGIMITLFEHKHFSRLKFLLASIFTPLLVLPLVAALTLGRGQHALYVAWNVIWCYGGSVAAALVFMPLVAIFEGIFNIADDFRLSELCSLANPLLKRLASEAPGTFNHSLVVGTLAEACASAIGENPNLARCAAYYHDIGKLKAPMYFSENQSSYNPHDELIPEVSVSMITSHTLFGEILAKQNRLPNEIIEVCRQHHGTAPVGYFYRKALTLKEEGDLAVDQYTYAGPKPQTKIAAIIMIADTIEAAMRSYMPDTKEEFIARINKLIDEKIEMYQFDECPITMADIATIKHTVIDVLPSIHHSRVSYDKKARENTFNK